MPLSEQDGGFLQGTVGMGAKQEPVMILAVSFYCGGGGGNEISRNHCRCGEDSTLYIFLHVKKRG
jgi:hypothetical protein